MVRIFYLSTALLLLTASIGARGQADVTVSGTVSNRTDGAPGVVTINFCNPFIERDFAVRLGEDGKFSATAPMEFAQNITIEYGGRYVNLYVDAGDSVAVGIDWSEKDGYWDRWLTIEGPNSQMSHQINRAIGHLYTIPYEEVEAGREREYYMQYVESTYQEYRAILDQMAVNGEVEFPAFEWLGMDLQLTALYGLCVQLDVNVGPEELRYVLENFIDITDPAYFGSMMFQTILVYYTYTLLHEPMGDGEQFVDQVLRVIGQLPEGVYRDFMLFTILPSIGSEADEYIKAKAGYYFVEPRYYLYMVDKLTPYQDVGAVELTDLYWYAQWGTVDKLPPADLLDALRYLYPGKLIYIDFWAVWCPPCLRGFDEAPAVHRKFDEGEVLFVNVCLQSDLGRWKEMIDEGRVPGENFFVDQDESRLLISQYNIQSFPSHMLMERDGTIFPGPVPSLFDGGKLVEFLKEHLD